MRALFAALLLFLAATGPAFADKVETAGKGIAIALPLIAGGWSLYKGDRTGLAELTVDTLATVGTAYALKNIVREQRPDKSDYQILPVRYRGAGLRAGPIYLGPLWLGVWHASLCRGDVRRL